MMRRLAQWRNIRSYATKAIPRSRIPSGGVSRSRGPGDLPPLTSPSEVVTLVVWGTMFHAFLEWNRVHACNMYQTWKAESKLQNMVAELDRKKKESPEAYLEMIHRELMSLKELGSKREKLAEWEVKNYERKVAVLESKLHEWAQGEDTASVRRGYIWQNDGFVCGFG